MGAGVEPCWVGLGARSVARSGWPLVVGAPGVVVAAMTLAAPNALRFAAAYVVGVVALLALAWLLGRAIGLERSTWADALTAARWMAGALLLGTAALGQPDLPAALRWLAFLVALVAATASDWLDGPLARRLGPTALGRSLDIEADSWLTLWCAGAAVAWGDLPWFCLAPPIVRYSLPLVDVARGGLPR